MTALKADATSEEIVLSSSPSKIVPGEGAGSRMSEFEIARGSGCCGACQRALVEGEVYHSVVLERPGGFERVDRCAACWQGPEASAVCHFRSRVPPARKARRQVFVSDSVLLDFFNRLGVEAGAGDASRADFRFVLALILMRKRLLRYERTVREGEAELWELRQPKESVTHRILNPQIDEERIARLTTELSLILATDAPDGEPAADTGAPAEPTHA